MPPSSAARTPSPPPTPTLTLRHARPFQGWEDEDGYEGRVLKTGVYEQVEDWLLVKLKEPLTGLREDGAFADPTVFTATLGNAAAGRAFFIPRRYVQTGGAGGEIQEDTEVHVLVESMKSFNVGEAAPDKPRSAQRLASLTGSIKQKRKQKQVPGRCLP